MKRIKGDRYGSMEDEIEGTTTNITTSYQLQDEPTNSLTKSMAPATTTAAAATTTSEKDGLMRDEPTMVDHGYVQHADGAAPVDLDEYNSDDDDDDDDDDEEEFEITIEELLYSASSYHAIAKPVTIAMTLSALAVVLINNAESRAEGQQAMANAYQIWSLDGSTSSSGQTLALSLANSLAMVSVFCIMTFVIVFLYKMRFMKCLIGYMIFCSCSLLGLLGGNMLRLGVNIYNIPVDKLTFVLFVLNFGVVGVISIFFGLGIPKLVTQGYLIATAVILAWHLSYFDEWSTWTFLFVLALYDLCAVLTPCGPLKALVELMSKDEAPEMPGLLFEAELPPETKRPGMARSSTGLSQSSSQSRAQSRSSRTPKSPAAEPSAGGAAEDAISSARSKDEEGPVVNIPFAIARVYSLKIVAIPMQSRAILNHNRSNDLNVAAAPLLVDDSANELHLNLPEEPSVKQLRAIVTVRLPQQGGRLEEVSRRGKTVFLERDRHGNPKRILWVDRNGKVYAEMREDDEEGPSKNTIRLGLGDFVFYSVLVAKAAEYSFSTFAACTLVILAGLGGTLVLLSVYHHALPALPISIFLGIIAYLCTRYFVEPWIEAVLMEPYYV
jgi:presenilin 1